MKNKLIILIMLIASIVYGQTYTVGDYVNDFSGDICYNGDGTWSYNEHGLGRVTWINLFTSW